jgi:TRAP-type C4-dicarboxylate transport system substrate-binding protein
MMKQIDILNIPFWSADAIPYTKVFNSQVFKKHILSGSTKYKIEVLFPYIIGSRTATSTKKYGKIIKDPNDFTGLKIRIPNSRSLRNFYKISNSNPITIPWGLAAKNARGNRFEALDSSPIGLYAGPDNLKKSIGKISLISSVHDGWVAIANSDFLESLDSKTKTQFLDAMEEIQREQMKLYQKAENYTFDQFRKLGAQIYRPTKLEIKKLAESFGHTHNSWKSIKKNLLGANGINIFEKLLEASYS